MEVWNRNKIKGEDKMTKYRKKPVVIEAFQYDGDLIDSTGYYYVPEWAQYANFEGILYYGDYKGKPGELFIKTLEGNMHVNVGDYIIKGIQGEIYPCKPSIFEATYEKVNDENSETITKETSLNVIVESLIEGANSFIMKCPSCNKKIISSQQAYIHDNIKREWYCRNCGQKLNNYNLLKEV